MAQNQNGFNRRSSNATRTYPGTATRLSAVGPPLVGGSSRSPPGTGSVPTVFVRPLSRSQLAPVHGGAMSSSSFMSESSSRQSPSTRTISLDQPRSETERHRNLYLGAPISHNSSSGGGVGVGGGGSDSSNNCTSSYNSKICVDSSITAAEQVRLPTNSRTKKGHSDTNSQVAGVVTTQPTKRTLLEPGISDDKKIKLAESSITCPCCRKCRCAACATPRPLPSRWICSKTIHCGPEPVLDYVTCLCCVKAVFYHCGKDHEPDGGVMCADKPCSCAPHRKFWRWGCMAAMSLVFPCLCLYWPCKGCIRLTEKAYQKYHNNGCKCSQSSSPGFETTPSVPTRGDSSGTHQSEDESNRGSNIFSHPPVVAARVGSKGKGPSHSLKRLLPE